MCQRLLEKNVLFLHRKGWIEVKLLPCVYLPKVSSVSPRSTRVLSLCPSYHSPHWGQSRFFHVIPWLKVLGWLYSHWKGTQILFFFFHPWGAIHPAPAHHSEFNLYHLPLHLPALRPCFRTDAEAKTPVLWPPDAKSWLIRKDHDAGKDWRREERGTTEDEMVGWHHRLNGHEFE